jgi:NAD-dependent dihydropyrimidine dehydrogenase PreA subunit
MAIEKISGCIGCENCVKACPTDVIRMNPQTGQAYIAYQDDCQICHLCRLSCPVAAISLTSIKAIKPTISWG